MTFEELRKLYPVKNEIILIDEDGDERKFIGFDRDGFVVTDTLDEESFIAWTESEIENWTIKKPEKRKLYQWIFADKETGQCWVNECFIDESGFYGTGKKCSYWSDAYHRQKIGEAITNEFIKDL